MADLKNMNDKLNTIEGIQKGTPIGMLEMDTRINNLEGKKVTFYTFSQETFMPNKNNAEEIRKTFNCTSNTVCGYINIGFQGSGYNSNQIVVNNKVGDFSIKVEDTNGNWSSGYVPYIKVYRQGNKLHIATKCSANNSRYHTKINSGFIVY